MNCKKIYVNICTIIICIITLIVTLGLSLGLFFGLNYPEIKTNNFRNTMCLINNNTINLRFCCSKTCYGCSSTSSNFGCDNLISYYQSNYNPIGCGKNTSNCPANGQECNNGDYCCNTCCSTCQICSSSTSSNSCFSTVCNCYCCDKISNQKCQIYCSTCYLTILFVTYSTDIGITNSTITRDFGTNLNDAQIYISQYAVNNEVRCYYNPDNYQDVILDKSYSTWKWILVAFPIFFFFISVFYFLILLMIKYEIIDKIKQINLPTFRFQSHTNNVTELEMKPPTINPLDPPPSYEQNQNIDSVKNPPPNYETVIL